MQYKSDIVEYFDIVKDSEVQKHVLVHGVNCVGKFNSGIAKQIRINYPVVYNEYFNYYNNNKLKTLLGEINNVKIGKTGQIVNAFTQQFYGRDPNYVYLNYRALQSCLEKVSDVFPDCCILLPKIGAGLANGDWNEIEKIIKETLKNQFFIIFDLN